MRHLRGTCIMPEHKTEKGFTVIEIIATLIIIGIISVIAIARMSSTSDVLNKAQAETLKSHIRYVQMRSMNTDSETVGCEASFGISMDKSNYFMFKNCDTDQKVTLPGESQDVISFKNCTLSPKCTVNFDRYGRPSTHKLGASPDNVSINLTLGTESIIITRDTGFVP